MCLKMENEIIKEILDEIESSLKDPKGIKSHQRRLAFSLSLGSITLLEIYLKKLNVLKLGMKINHQWFKKKKENVKEILSKYVTSPMNKLSDIDEVLSIIYEIERERNELAYGKIASEEKLREKINLFLELKKRVENV